MSKKPQTKAMRAGEAAVWFLFVVAGGLASLSLLGMINLTDQAQTMVGYAISSFTALVFGYLVWKAVENK